jgi:hypothetical protein
MLLKHSRRTASAGGLAGLVLLMAGCADTATSRPVAHAVSASRSVTPPGPGRAVETPAQAAQAAQAALAAYRAMWADVAAVADSGDYRRSRLGDHLTGQLLLTSSKNLSLAEQHGTITKGAPIPLRPAVAAENLSANPPEITVSDCIDGSRFRIYYAATGKPVNNNLGGLQSATAKMILTGGAWKATSEYVGAVGSCAG